MVQHRGIRKFRGIEAFVIDRVEWLGLVMFLGMFLRGVQAYSGLTFNVAQVLGPTLYLMYNVGTGFAIATGAFAVMGKAGKQADYFADLARATERNRALPKRTRDTEAQSYRRRSRTSRFYSFMGFGAEVWAAFSYTAVAGQEGIGREINQFAVAASLVLFAYFLVVVNTTIPRGDEAKPEPLNHWTVTQIMTWLGTDEPTIRRRISRACARLVAEGVPGIERDPSRGWLVPEVIVKTRLEDIAEAPRRARKPTQTDPPTNHGQEDGANSLQSLSVLDDGSISVTTLEPSQNGRVHA